MIDLTSVCVFCGSNMGARPEYRACAEQFGTEVARRGLRLVYGGGAVGLMGVAADAALAAGGKVSGIIPYGLQAREVAHTGGAEMHVVDTMHERKAMMNQLSDGFVVLPGGFGTLEEAVEALTWAQLGIQKKGVVFLDIHDYWKPFLASLDHMVEEGFIRPQHRPLAMRATSPAEALDMLAAYAPPPGTQPWLRMEEM